MNLTLQHKQILLAIHQCDSWPTQKQLRNRTRFSLYSLRNQMPQLQDKGVIESTRIKTQNGNPYEHKLTAKGFGVVCAFLSEQE